jgi:hypothetical protein
MYIMRAERVNKYTLEREAALCGTWTNYSHSLAARSSHSCARSQNALLSSASFVTLNWTLACNAGRECVRALQPTEIFCMRDAH